MTKVAAEKGDLRSFKADAIVLNVFKGVKRPVGATGAVDDALGGAIKAYLSLGDFKGKEGEVHVLGTWGKISAPRVLLVGLGPKKDFDLERIRNVSARAAIVARGAGWNRLATVLHGAGIGGISSEDAARALAEGVLLGLFRFREFKSKPKKDGKKGGEDEEEDDEEGKELASCTIVESDPKKLAAIRRGIHEATILCEATNLARTLIMRPSISKSPPVMARIAQEEGKKVGLKVTVFDERALKTMGAGLILGVGAGAGPGRGPRLVVLEHKGGKSKKTVALVGKGITFDSGGINIKPSQGMEQMKYDMAGSATVLGAILAAARLKVPHRVVALMALAENMPSGTAIRPGDVLTALDGTHVEVDNTDAEGRLVLGDALAYVVKTYKPDVILDVATLTGSVKVALGDMRTGVLGNDDALYRKLAEIGKKTGDRLWQLPLDDGDVKLIKSDVADIKNTGPRYGGAIHGAAFLKHFVGKKAKWAHFDIAGTCWTDKAPGELRKEYIGKGATGVAVRLFVEFLRDLR